MGRQWAYNRTCEPVMIRNEDIGVIDGIIVERYGEDILEMSRRKELVAARKDVIHEVLVEGMKALEQKAIKKKRRVEQKGKRTHGEDEKI